MPARRAFSSHLPGSRVHGQAKLPTTASPPSAPPLPPPPPRPVQAKATLSGGSSQPVTEPIRLILARGGTPPKGSWASDPDPWLKGNRTSSGSYPPLLPSLHLLQGSHLTFSCFLPQDLFSCPIRCCIHFSAGPNAHTFSLSHVL